MKKASKGRLEDVAALRVPAMERVKHLVEMADHNALAFYAVLI